MPAIYERAVIAEGALLFPDILERVEGGFVLIEVKSRTSVSEQKHIPDIAWAPRAGGQGYHGTLLAVSEARTRLG